MRRRASGPPKIHTTVSITFEDYEWIRKHPGMEASSLLARMIRALRKQEEEERDPTKEEVSKMMAEIHAKEEAERLRKAAVVEPEPPKTFFPL